MESMLGLVAASRGVCAVRRVAQLFLASVLAAYAVAPHSALATTVTLPASQDSWVEQANQSTNHGGDTTLRVQGGTGPTAKKRALVQFDLSSIPACASVSSAILKLQIGSSTTSTTHEVRAITQSWTEGGVTWLSRDGTNSWSAAGGAFSGTVTANATTGTAAGPITWDVTADVLSFLAGSSPNNGWIVKVASEGTAVAHTYDSREGTTPPSLAVTYTLVDANCPSDGNECTADTCTPSGCQYLALDGQPCGDPASTECTNPDTCDANGVCQPNDEDPGTPCGNPGTECKNQDTCDGAGSCTDNGFMAPDTPCGDPSDTQCTHPDSCDGAGTCQANNEAPGTFCGDAGTECTNQDTCNNAGSCTDNGFKDPGTPCGDHSQTACTDPDTCNGAGACLANNQVDGTTCNDGDACTATDTCQSGICNGQDVICGPSAVCSPQPKTGCRNPTESNKASVLIKNTTPDTSDRLIWSWIKGAQTPTASFGDPANGSTGYRLCVYDETGGVPAEVHGVSVQPGGLCGPRQKPCWKRLGRQTAPTGYVYTDPNAVGGGVFKVLLHEGAAGKARVLFKAKGSNVGPPTLPLHQDGAVIVQLNRTDEPTECWEAEYSGPAKNRDVGKGIKFFDKGD